MESKEFGRILIAIPHHLAAEQKMFETGVLEVPVEPSAIEPAHLAPEDPSNFEMTFKPREKQRPKIDLSSTE
jgi:hypothetical protein